MKSQPSRVLFETQPLSTSFSGGRHSPCPSPIPPPAIRVGVTVRVRVRFIPSPPPLASRQPPSGGEFHSSQGFVNPSRGPRVSVRIRVRVRVNVMNPPMWLLVPSFVVKG